MTLSNCRSEVKINEIPSSNFCRCTSGFQKYAHVLNKPNGSCCLKYAGTKGRFYYSICSATILLISCIYTGSVAKHIFRRVFICITNLARCRNCSFFGAISTNTFTLLRFDIVNSCHSMLPYYFT
jgi:hypothetical protein